MSVVSMQKMSLVAHSSERTKLLRIFIKAGCVELVGSPENVTVTNADRQRREEMERKRFRALFCINFLKEYSKEILKLDKKAAPKVDLKRENRLISLEEYEEVCNNTEELFGKIDEMEALNNRVVDLRSEKTRLQSLCEQLRVYKDLDVNMQKTKGNTYVRVFCGLIPTGKVAALQQAVEEESRETPVYAQCVTTEKNAENASEVFVRVPTEGEGIKNVPVLLVCPKEKEETFSSALAACEFIPTTFDFDATPAEKLAETEERIRVTDDTIRDLIMKTKDYVKYLPTVKIVYDYYALEIAKLDVTENSARTKKAIAFEGWVPEDKVEELKKTIDGNCSRVVYAFRAPLEDETPPTLTKNNKVVSAFSGITSMFGEPNYKEQDPNLFVAFFYFLIFGIMIGDAGYGLIMAIACFLFVKIKKPVKNSGRMLIMFAFCGISTFIWGILFGGWFAIKIPAGSFLDKITWFQPLEHPIKMFVLSLVVGVLQIGTGFALSGIARIKSKKPVNVAKGILSDFGWVIILLGLLFLFPNILCFMDASVEKLPWFNTLGSIGMYTALVGAAMMIVGGAVGKKNPIKMVGGSLGSAYGAINVVSDLLSYSRLFGLGLTTGVIGLVMNELGTLVAGMIPVAGWIFAVIIFIGGHIFNLAINLLGAYVHDSRLQYIEFFGRFYEGSGRAFRPLGGEMKYTYLDN